MKTFFIKFISHSGDIKRLSSFKLSFSCFWFIFLLPFKRFSQSQNVWLSDMSTISRRHLRLELVGHLRNGTLGKGFNCFLLKVWSFVLLMNKFNNFRNERKVNSCSEWISEEKFQNLTNSKDFLVHLDRWYQKPFPRCFHHPILYEQVWGIEQKYLKTFQVSRP